MKIIKSKIENHYIIDSEKSWKTITIFAWIHWDEISWINALNELLKKFEKKELTLKNWKLNLVTLCNIKANKENKRFISKDLNRCFKKSNLWENPEEIRALELMNILDESDILLDLHSTSAKAMEFAFAETKALELAKNIWIKNIIAWWWELWDQTIAWDTENYMNSLWWIWITFEAWSHLDKDAKNKSLQVSLNLLSQFEMIDNWYFKALEWVEKIAKISEIYVSETWNFNYEIKDIYNLKFIKSWEIIWIDDWKIISYNKDILLIMPSLNIQAWKEIFFVWNIL